MMIPWTRIYLLELTTCRSVISAIRPLIAEDKRLQAESALEGKKKLHSVQTVLSVSQREMKCR